MDVCASGDKMCLFFKKFGVFCFIVAPVLRFALLLYYQRFFKIEAARRFHEDKRICKLKALATHSLNTEIVDSVKEIYIFHLFSKSLFYKSQYYVYMIMKLMTDFGPN